MKTFIYIIELIFISNFVTAQNDNCVDLNEIKEDFSNILISDSLNSNVRHFQNSIVKTDSNYYITIEEKYDTSLNAEKLVTHWKSYYDEDYSLKRRNILEISITTDTVLYEYISYSNKDHRDAYIYDFITNSLNRSDFPEKKLSTKKYFGEITIPNYYISFAADLKKNRQNMKLFENYFYSYYNLRNIIYEIRDNLALSRFNKNFEELTIEQRRIICEIYPLKIEFHFQLPLSPFAPTEN